MNTPVLVRGQIIEFDVDRKTLRIGTSVLQFVPKWIKRPGRLYLIFSKECNLNCIYCFQNGSERKRLPLNIEDVCSVIKSLQNEISEIVLFGGEPLLEGNYPLITTIFERFDYLNILVFSNGNFDGIYRDLLLQYDYTISGLTISVDGPAEIHNKRRINKEKNSFQTIIDNLLFLKQLGRKVNISINVDLNNFEYIESLLEEMIKELQLTEFEYTINPVKYTKSSVDFLDLFTLFFSLRRKYGKRISINNRFIYNLEAMLSNSAMQRERCEIESTYVIDFPLKKIYACPQNETSEIGSLDDENRILVDKQNISEIISATSFFNQPCSECSLNYLCPYNCPFAPNDKHCRDKVKELLIASMRNIDCLLTEDIIVNYF